MIDDTKLKDLEEWLQREMPAGTVIGDPKWWAKKIYNAVLSKEDKRCLEIGRAIERAAEKLPFNYGIVIELEKDAGIVKLILPDYTEIYFEGSDTFAQEINTAIDGAIEKYYE